ncbi:MAG TPA: helix-turn-helix transcriptional regulator [Candidatus Dormibacteraeota bacterium]
MTTRLRYTTVWYRGIPYTLDLARCRRALVHRQVEGAFSSMEGLARSIGVSRSTVSRFFAGRPTSLAVTLNILDALHLTFEEVATPDTDDPDDPAGPSSAGVGARPSPRLPGTGSLTTVAASPSRGVPQ